MSSLLRARLPLVLAIVVGLAISWGLARRTSGPGSETAPDRAGPARVILFAPNLEESAWMLGYGERIVGVTDFCVWPPELLTRPRVGGMINPNLERILALEPDLLVVQGESATLLEFARSHSIATTVVSMDLDVQSIFAGIARLDSLLSGGTSERAAQLTDEMRAGLQTVQAAGAQHDHRPTALLVLGHDPGSLANLYTTGRGTFLNELVALAGGRALYEDHERSYFILSQETLASDPPDVGLELRPGAAPSQAQRAKIVDVWAQAGLPTRVEIVDFDGVLIPGPRIVETARVFQRALFPVGEP